MSLQEFRDLLLGITEKAYHFEAAQDARTNTSYGRRPAAELCWHPIAGRRSSMNFAWISTRKRNMTRCRNRS